MTSEVRMLQDRTASAATYSIGSLVLSALAWSPARADPADDGKKIEACWVWPPYPLVHQWHPEFQYQYSTLVRGHPKAKGEDALAHDGIVVEKRLLNDISGIALTPRFALCRRQWLTHGHELHQDFAAIDLTDENASVRHFATQLEFEDFVKAQSDVSLPVNFETFDKIYEREGPWYANKPRVVLIMVAGLAALCIAFASPWLLDWCRDLVAAFRARIAAARLRHGKT
jgi:hypothetical protein